jgi:hypothetical protein
MKDRFLEKKHKEGIIKVNHVNMIIRTSLENFTEDRFFVKTHIRRILLKLIIVNMMCGC